MCKLNIDYCFFSFNIKNRIYTKIEQHQCAPLTLFKSGILLKIHKTNNEAAITKMKIDGIETKGLAFKIGK